MIKSRVSIYGQQSSLQTSARTSVKESLKVGRRKDIVQESGDILIKACCPNCRYVFTVVNQNKLGTVKKKMQALDPILEVKSQTAKSRDLRSIEPSLINQPQNKIPFSERTSNIKQVCELKSLSKQKSEQKAQTKIKTPKFHLPRANHNTQTKKNQKSIPNLSKKVTPEKQKRKSSEMRQRSKEQQPNFRKLSNTLGQNDTKRKSSRSKSKSRSSDNEPVEIKINNLPVFAKQQIRVQNFETSQQFQNIFEKEFSSIGKPEPKVIEIKRACSCCEARQIDIEIALQASKAKLIEQQANIISRFVYKDTSIPSYIKCLGMLLQSN